MRVVPCVRHAGADAVDLPGQAAAAARRLKEQQQALLAAQNSREHLDLLLLQRRSASARYISMAGLQVSMYLACHMCRDVQLTK